MYICRLNLPSLLYCKLFEGLNVEYIYGVIFQEININRNVFRNHACWSITFKNMCALHYSIDITLYAKKTLK